VSVISSERGRMTRRSDDERARMAATKTSPITLTAASDDAA
jgi:hypothetical protein